MRLPPRVLLLLVSLLTAPVAALEPFTTAAFGIGIAIGGYLMWPTDCQALKHDYEGLQNNISSSLFGQHIARDTIVKSIRVHMENPNPSKALGMIFYGPTGTGKNYAVNFIADRLFGKHAKDFVHVWKDTHVTNVEKYMAQRAADVSNFAKTCGRSIFVFDEVHQMPEGSLRFLNRYMDKGFSKVDGVDFRKSIFIFLSNGGAGVVSDVALNASTSGRSRESITRTEMEAVVSRAAFKEGGLKNAGIIENSLINHSITFFPLEQHHVERCIKEYLMQRYPQRADHKDLIKKILKEFPLFPENKPIFVSSGCKIVEERAGFHTG